MSAALNGKAGGIPLQGKPLKILTLSRHVLDNIRYGALFCVVHVTDWLLKYVSSNNKYRKVWRISFASSTNINTLFNTVVLRTIFCMCVKLCSRVKCWQVAFRFNCHNNFLFFPRKNQLFSDLRAINSQATRDLGTRFFQESHNAFHRLVVVLGNMSLTR